MSPAASNVRRLVESTGLSLWDFAFHAKEDFRLILLALEQGACGPDLVGRLESAFSLPKGTLLSPAYSPSPVALAPQHPVAARVSALIDLHRRGRVAFARSAKVAPETMSAILRGAKSDSISVGRIANFAGLTLDDLTPGKPFNYERAIASFDTQTPETLKLNILRRLDSLDESEKAIVEELRKMREERAAIKTLLSRI